VLSLTGRTTDGPTSATSAFLALEVGQQITTNYRMKFPGFS